MNRKKAEMMAGTRKKAKGNTADIARVGKDEMNLAEFPTAILTTRSQDGVKTLRFQDGHGQLTVTGSDALGLPTPIDTDVMVALIELTKKKNNFTEPKVNFTRYELIRLIGWANVGSSYDRLKESLDRWAGVLLIYDGCWWDNRHKQYVSKTVHIIEDIVIADGKLKTEKDGRQESLPLSSFTWSGHFMESFQANNLKSLDTAFYFSLKYPTSKQLFRFLDKRFAAMRSDWTFDLEELAFERVGLSRSYKGNVAKVKEKLADALAELEAKGFLTPLTREERYFKTEGSWKIRLIDGRRALVVTPVIESLPTSPAPLPLVAELVKREVSDKTAAALVANHLAETIQQKIELFDWLKDRQDKRIGQNPAGYLVKSITDDYKAPKGFKTKAQRQEETEAKRLEQQAKADAERRKREADAQARQEQKLIAAYWQGLSQEQQAAHDAEAIAQADAEELTLIEPGPMQRIGMTLLRDKHTRQLLEAQGKLPPSQP